MPKDAQIKKILGEFDTNVLGIMLFIGVETTKESIEGTPVDTGWARSNWIPSVGSPVIGADLKNPSPSDVAGQVSTQQASIAELTKYKLKDGKIYITNSVRYITKLEEGSSTQAPEGFVRQAIQKALTSTSRLGSL